MHIGAVGENLHDSLRGNVKSQKFLRNKTNIVSTTHKLDVFFLIHLNGITAAFCCFGV